MKPDETSRSTLGAVIANDVEAINALSSRLEDIPLPRNGGKFVEMAASAYLLHNIYNALENSFEQISRTFENHVKDPVQWHKELLGKMFLEIPGVRPAILPRDLHGILNELRGFRHVFRHGYDFDLDPVRLELLITRFRDSRNGIVSALALFREWLMQAETVSSGQ